MFGIVFFLKKLAQNIQISTNKEKAYNYKFLTKKIYTYLKC